MVQEREKDKERKKETVTGKKGEKDSEWGKKGEIANDEKGEKDREWKKGDIERKKKRLWEGKSDTVRKRERKKKILFSSQNITWQIQTKFYYKKKTSLKISLFKLFLTTWFPFFQSYIFNNCYYSHPDCIYKPCWLKRYLIIFVFALYIK